MNEQLKQLIEQYERETGLPARNPYGMSFTDGFVYWLASRPTCGKEQRKFLYLLEKHGEIHEGNETKWKKLVLSNGVIQENCKTEIFENSEGFDSLDLHKILEGE